MKLTDEEAARLWTQIDKRGETECWSWSGYAYQGSAKFRIGKRRRLSVRKIIYELFHGSVNERVIPKCNNTLCCNPTHLRLEGDLESLFWSRVDRKGESECWIWNGCVSKGRGLLRHNNKNHQAHRIAYTLMIGVLNGSEEVHQTCNNKLCCNPSHLQRVGRNGSVKTLSEAARSLAESCYNLAWKKALQISGQTGADPDDLLSEAMWVLCRMAGWYDPEKGKPFPPIVGKYITKRLKSYIAKQNSVKEISFVDYFGEDWTSDDIQHTGD